VILEGGRREMGDGKGEKSIVDFGLRFFVGGDASARRTKQKERSSK